MTQLPVSAMITLLSALRHFEKAEIELKDLIKKNKILQEVMKPDEQEQEY